MNTIIISGTTFYWRNFTDVDPDRVGQSVYDADKKFIAEREGCLVDSEEQIEGLETWITNNCF